MPQIFIRKVGFETVDYRELLMKKKFNGLISPEKREWYYRIKTSMYEALMRNEGASLEDIYVILTPGFSREEEEIQCLREKMVCTGM